MKTAVSVFLMLLIATVVRAEPVIRDADTLLALGGRFVDAIAHEDIAATKACWCSIDKMKELAANPPAGTDVSELSDKNLEHMKTQWKERDDVIDARLRDLVVWLKGRGSPLSKIKLAEITSRQPETEGGVACVDDLEVIMTIGDVRIGYRLGNAIQLKGRWYCTRLPGTGATLIRNNKPESIPREQPKKTETSDKE